MIIGERLKIPVISMATSVMLPWGNDRINNPDNPSFIPVLFTSYLSKMSLIERIDNAVSLMAVKIWYFFARMTINVELQNNFGKNVSNYYALEQNTSIIFTNSYFAVNNVRPFVDSLKEVGGLHIVPPSNLKLKGLEDILNVTSTQKYKGVIYFSMGSMVLTETFPMETIAALFDAFSELPYQILWKASKEKMPSDINIPSNIHFESWIPQMEVLCNSNVKLFVTHGGLMSAQEATYCGVPCLGIPLFADQELNMKALGANGFALTVNYEGITKEAILTTSLELLNNPKYKANADLASKRFRDRPLSPLDTAVFWVEYVIRHHGARHLRSTGADLPWYQYHLLDVIVFLVFVLLTSLYIIYKVLVVFLKLLFNFNKTKSQKQD